MSGTASTSDYDALSANIREWSDGYAAEIAVTIGTANANAGSAAKLVLAVGQGVQTATTQPTGAYVASWSKAADNTQAADVIFAYAATGRASKDVSDLTISGMTDITDTTDNTDFGFTKVLGTTGDTMVDTTVLKVKAYMPKEATTPAADTETTATGDRLDKGDVLSVWSAFAADAVAPDASCTATVTVLLGAATLAAGSLATAAALAF
jgi:hypothetical protein